MSNPRIPFLLSTQRPRLPAFKGKPLLVHVVVNLEVWRFSEQMPRTLLSSPRGVQTVPDVPNFSWVEYGMRCGFPRIMELLRNLDIPASASLNSDVIEVYPAVAEAVLKANWEFIGHGTRQQAAPDVRDERAMILAAVTRIEEFSGSRPRGWLGPGLAESFETPDLLAEAGIEYVLDWPLDDLPDWIRTETGRLLAIPYSLELNDSVLHAVEHYSANEMVERVRNTLAVFDTELLSQTRVLTLPVHPHLAGVPHRIGVLSSILDELANREDTAFVTGSEILDWYRWADSTVR